jgi:hypothetical protein
VVASSSSIHSRKGTAPPKVALLISCWSSSPWHRHRDFGTTGQHLNGHRPGMVAVALLWYTRMLSVR